MAWVLEMDVGENWHSFVKKMETVHCEHFTNLECTFGLHRVINDNGRYQIDYIMAKCRF